MERSYNCMAGNTGEMYVSIAHKRRQSTSAAYRERSIDLVKVLEIGPKEEHVTPRPWVWVVCEMQKCPDDVQCGARF